MNDYKNNPPLWRQPILLVLLIAASLGSNSFAVDKESSKENHSVKDRKQQSFVVTEIANLLPEDQKAVWTKTASKIDQADRLGPLLLQWFLQIEPKLGDVLTGNPKMEIPDWLAEEDSLYHSVAPSLRLAVAENYFFREHYNECLVWCNSLEDADVYSIALREYLKTVTAFVTVDYAKAKDSLALLSDDYDNFGLARRKTLEQIKQSLEIKEPKKLHVVANRMEDVERRLALGQGNQLTQDQQQRVIDDLDELIKNLEEKQKQQQQASSSNAAPSGTPAEESRAGEYKGPGQVDRKRFSSGDPWGALSPAERERLSQGIDRDFPGHYRRLIEGYYQRLADADPEETDLLEVPNSKQGSER